MSQLIAVPFVLAAAYLFGSIPNAWIAGQLRGIEIRDVGSGSVGATNVFRTLGTKTGVAVMVADVLKGVMAVLLAQALTDNPWPLFAALVAIAGHAFPVWLTFRGGKGVAVGLGGIMALFPLAGVFLVAIWLILVVTTRYVSVASIVGALAFPPLAIVVGASLSEAIFACVAAAAVIYFHRGNIGRLIRGEELRIEFRRRKTSPAA